MPSYFWGHFLNVPKIRGSIVTTPKGKIKNEWLGEIIKAPNITILLDPNGTMQLIDCECDRYE